MEKSTNHDNKPKSDGVSETKHVANDANTNISRSHAKDYFFESNFFRGMLYVVLGVIFILLVFRTGMIVGYQKALFSMHSSDNYEQIFVGPHRGDGIGFVNDDFPNANGMIGQIIQIGNNTLVLRAEDQMEKSIQISSSTMIKQFQYTILLNQLKLGDTVAVIGSPNSLGQIEADLVRYLPPKPVEFSSSGQAR